MKSNARLRREAKQRRLLENEVLTISGEVMERVGRDLHDGLSQKLAAFSMLASALEGRLSADSHPGASAAGELVAFLNGAVVDSKNIDRGLYPAELERNGLVPAIEELVSSARRLSTVEISLVVRAGPKGEDPAAAIQVYRIVQEALGNALKHANAARIELRVDARDDISIIDITDDGIGIPEDLSANKGMGVRIMQYRADMIHATLGIRRLHPGTRVSVTCLLSGPAHRYHR